MKEGKFETTLSELETIVEKLEEGNLSLEESLALFERGVKLSADGFKMLDESEIKIGELVKQKISILGEECEDDSDELE